MSQAAEARTSHARTLPSTATVKGALHVANIAAAAFPVWSATSATARRAVLMRAADLVEQRAEAFVTNICTEIGGTRAWGELNVRLGASILREAGAITTQVAGEVLPSEQPGTLAMGIRQPCGVVLSMAPWNAPVVLSARAVATPLACGNTVVFKASELCPATHQLLVDCVVEAGLPAGALGIVHSAPADAEEMVGALIGHPAVRRVNFTGSTRVGRVIAELCARHLKRPLLELGGKAPLVVLDDADLDAAVSAAAYGAFFHQGQICMSTERLIVPEALADEFVEKLRARAERIIVGDPSRPDSGVGPMISEQAAQRVRGLIDDAVRLGARLVCGGRQRGAYLDATVLDAVTPDMRIYNEETFGPVASVIRYADVDEAVSIANDTEYGLSASVFGRDVMRAMAVARRLETGICHVNSSTIHDEPNMPFGGVKASGFGRFGGHAGIEEFTELRWITVRGGPQEYPL